MKIALPFLILLITNSALCQGTNVVKEIDTSRIAILPSEEYVFDKLTASMSIDEIQLTEEISGKGV